MENPNYEQVVKEAAKYLDGTEPGWHKKIDRGTLSIAGSCECVMGQLHGCYSVGMWLHFPHPRVTGTWSTENPLTRAFDSEQSTLKTKLWLREISARLEADKRQHEKVFPVSPADAFIERTNQIINLPAKVWEEPTRA